VATVTNRLDCERLVFSPAGNGRQLTLSTWREAGPATCYRNHRLRWTDKPPEFQQAVYANRRRVKRAKSKRWQRLRSERCERTFAHVCDTGGMRRSWVQGVAKLAKRYLIVVAAHNLGRILRKLFGIGKPKALQDAGGFAALAYLLVVALTSFLASRHRRAPSGPATLALLAT
jgi:hypothetical protein